jgi:hypothetical protein
MMVGAVLLLLGWYVTSFCLRKETIVDRNVLPPWVCIPWSMIYLLCFAFTAIPAPPNCHFVDLRFLSTGGPRMNAQHLTPTWWHLITQCIPNSSFLICLFKAGRSLDHNHACSSDAILHLTVVWPGNHTLWIAWAAVIWTAKCRNVVGYLRANSGEARTKIALWVQYDEKLDVCAMFKILGVH